MIKLIACDIDGTLLQKNETKISSEVFSEIKRLSKMGISFCPASGRQYESLRKLFAPVRDEIYYICENGSIVFKPGKNQSVLFKSVMQKDDAVKLANSIAKTSYGEVLISGANISYLIPKDPDFPAYIRDVVGNNISVISDAAEIKEDIIKISVCCDRGKEYFVENFKDFGPFEPVASGDHWLDVTISDKGKGISSISKTENIPLSDIMAIGDNYNDISMLDIVGHPYIMENAADELKRRYKNRCLRVEKTLSEI